VTLRLIDEVRVYNRALSDAEVDVLAQEVTETTYLADALGSVVGLMNTGKVVATQYAYEPFGATTTSGMANGNPYKFTGREEDGTGLYFYRARYYHPSLGRFISEDPIGYGGGDINLFAYVGSDPINLRDPSGLMYYWPWLYQALRAVGFSGGRAVVTSQIVATQAAAAGCSIQILLARGQYGYYQGVNCYYNTTFQLSQTAVQQFGHQIVPVIDAANRYGTFNGPRLPQTFESIRNFPSRVIDPFYLMVTQTHPPAAVTVVYDSSGGANSPPSGIILNY
jgi:RHS repeat-associated protein